MVNREAYAGNLQKYLRIWFMLMTSDLLSHSQAHMQSKLNNLCYESKKAGLEINFSRLKSSE
jgi:hypothetical protein